jgi:hypothetical protein
MTLITPIGFWFIFLAIIFILAEIIHWTMEKVDKMRRNREARNLSKVEQNEVITNMFES